MSDAALDALLVDYFHDRLDAQARAVLEERLRTDGAARRRFAVLARHQLALREILLVRRDAALSSGRHFAPRRSRWHRLPLRVGFTAALTALLLIAVLVARNGPAPCVVSDGDAVIHRVGAPSIVAHAPGTRLMDGDRLVAAARCAVRFADGSQLTLLTGELVLAALAPDKRIELGSGSLAAEVASQALGARLLITTPQARVEVIGTAFTLKVGDGVTDIDVTSGAVRFTRLADGVSTVVGAGGRATSVATAAAAPRAPPAIACWTPQPASNSFPCQWSVISDTAGGPSALRMEFSYGGSGQWCSLRQELAVPVVGATALRIEIRCVRAAPGAEWNMGVHEADGDVWLVAFERCDAGPIGAWVSRHLAIEPGRIKLLFKGGDGSFSSPVKFFFVGIGRGDAVVEMRPPAFESAASRTP